MPNAYGAERQARIELRNSVQNKEELRFFARSAGMSMNEYFDTKLREFSRNFHKAHKPNNPGEEPL